MQYLLDADWAIQALAGRQRPAAILEQLIRTAGAAMSWVTVGELYDGAFGSVNPQAELAIYRRFLRPITLPTRPWPEAVHGEVNHSVGELAGTAAPWLTIAV